MKKTPKLNILSGPEAVLHPVVEVFVDAIVINSDAITLLHLKKTDKVELANQQSNRKKWYIRRSPKAGYRPINNDNDARATLRDSYEIAGIIRKIFGVAKDKALAGTISTKEEFNGWFAVNFLPVEI